jgi:hypothetical protein
MAFWKLTSQIWIWSCCQGISWLVEGLSASWEWFSPSVFKHISTTNQESNMDVGHQVFWHLYFQTTSAADKKIYKSNRLQLNIALCVTLKKTICFNNDKHIVIIIPLSGSWHVLSSIQLRVLKLLISIKAFVSFCQSLQAYNLKNVTAIPTYDWNCQSFLCCVTWSLHCFLK